MAKIQIKNLTRKFDNNVQALSGVSFDVDDKELLVVLGNSGCGKTTLLRVLAGLDLDYSGYLTINGKDSREIELKDRGVAMVFQNYALYPQLTVKQNLELPFRQKVFYRPVLDAAGNQVLGIDEERVKAIKEEIKNLERGVDYKANKKALKLRLKEAKKTKDTPVYAYQRIPPSEITSKVQEVAKYLELETFFNQTASTLSGGQKQRVALAKAMLKEPKILLLDEPTSNLDIKLRKQARELIRKVHDKCGCTTILVTHDQNDAYCLADRVLILKNGSIQQLGTNKEIIEKPNSVYVSQFFWNPPMALYGCVLDEKGIAMPNGETVGVDPSFLNKLPGHGELIVGIRPENMKAVKKGGHEAKVIRAELVGIQYIIHVELFGRETLIPSNDKKEPGEIIRLNINPRDFVFFDMKTKKRLN